ncbi:glucosamine-6-phosphate deaminase [Marinobacterium aestuariivivens]|uniref:Glucosamine-6-phosphate deaminase n=1 Tax=Marinobacterium aestuariivivens TaxID=1698799 RepID=A0ABW1ZZ57_9GAMM
MQVIIAGSPGEVASLAADRIERLLARHKAAVLGLATGSTPIALYQELIARYHRNQLSFREVTTFNLDEYVGLAPEHPQSYRTFMQRQLFDRIDIDPRNTHIPNGQHCPTEEAAAYETRIRSLGGIDLQVLGLGRNGHIGFNEPCSSLHSRTRIKTLAEATVRDNSRFFEPGEFMPKLAITMGIATILEARQILLLATGSAKAEAVRTMVEGPLSASCPASALQQHPNTLVIVDSEAGSQLSQCEYHRRVKIETDRLMDAERSRP